MTKDPIISVRINDVLKIYNTLLEHKNKKWLQDGDYTFKDPLFVLHEQLGENKIELDREFDPSIGDRKLNLRIKCRFLVNTSKLLRCQHC